jgi:hypothetical protein
MSLKALGTLSGIVAAGLLGVGLACVQLFPFSEQISQSDRPFNPAGIPIADARASGYTAVDQASRPSKPAGG